MDIVKILIHFMEAISRLECPELNIFIPNKLDRINFNAT